MQNEITIEAKELAEQAQPILTEVTELIVDSPEMFEHAADELKKVKRKSNEIEAKRKELKGPIIEAGRAIDSFFRPPLAILLEAETVLKRNISGFLQAQERIRIEDQRKADEEAARKQKVIDDVALEVAAKLSEQGLEEEAAVVVEQREKAITPIVAAIKPQVKGISTIKRWSAEITDIKAVCQSVIDGKIPESFIKFDMPKLNRMAVSLQDQMNIPGVKAVYTESISVRSA